MGYTPSYYPQPKKTWPRLGQAPIGRYKAKSRRSPAKWILVAWQHLMHFPSGKFSI
jgi:hypothetical protein